MLVEEYERLFPAEFTQFQVGMRAKKAQGSVNGAIKGMDYIERLVCEWPETLDTVFKKQLSPDDEAWLYTKEGIRWFARKFPQYSVIQKV